MADSILKSLKSFFTGNASVRKVADDPELTAELLLLFRVIMADGKMQGEEQKAFERLCQQSFGIDADDLPEVTAYLREFSYETTGAQALDMFAEASPERRLELVTHLRDMALADAHFTHDERKLVDKIAARLGVA
jgi:uncharacterized tellurite resistance protein B-like protein